MRSLKKRSHSVLVSRAFHFPAPIPMHPRISHLICASHRHNDRIMVPSLHSICAQFNFARKLLQTQQLETESNAHIRRSAEWEKKIRHSVWLRWWHPVASEWNGAKDKIIVFRRSPSSRWKSNGIFIWRVARSLYHAIIFIHGKALMCKPVSARSTLKHPYYCCHVPHSPAYMKNVPNGERQRKKKNGV